DNRFDLSAMANDAFILKQTIKIALREACDLVEIETMKRRTEVLALSEDGAPTQSRLKALETQLLEKAVIIEDRNTPLRIVIAGKLRWGSGPTASCFAIWTQ